MEGVKLLYDRKGAFTGKGIRFKVTVSGATLALYQGLWMEKEEDGSYKGVTAEVQDGKTIKITASETGRGGRSWRQEKMPVPARACYMAG